MSLLTYDKQQEIKPVSLNNKVKFEQLISEVEELELPSLLGSTFYFEILDNYTPTTTATTETTIYQDLVEGSTYVNSCGKTITQKGLQFVLAYLNHSQYVMEAHITDTLTGFVQKTRPDSEQINYPAQKNFSNHSKEIAMNQFELVKDFLNENYNSFENWNCATSNTSNINSWKIIGINKIK